MDVGSEPSRKPRRGAGGLFALKVTGAYVLVALAWVLLFYRLLPVLIRNQAVLHLFTATRVLFTAAVLYLVTWFAFGRLRRAQQRIAHLNAVLRAIRGVNQLITREKDRDRLLEQSCNLLTSTFGYRSAWILLTADDGRFITAAEAGLGERSDAFLDRLRRGDYPDCVRRCLREKSEQVLRAPRLSCRDCPLEHLEPGSSAQVAPLLHQGRLFGVLALTLPVHVEPTAEEQSLVAEVAGDIAFALATLKAESEHRQAEENVATLKQQMEFVLGATKTGLDMIDSDLNIRFIDPEWQKVYGDPKGKKCYEYFMGRSEPCPNCGVLLALQTKQPAVTEEILVKEGARPIQVTTIPFQNERGEWLVAEVNVDITERKRAEREVLSLARFPAENPHPILRVSTDGVVIYANRPAELLLNTIQCSSGQPLPEPYRSHVLEALASGARRDVEATFQDRTYVVTFAPIVEAGYANIYGRDITDRKKVEEALRESEERYRALTEQSPTFVLILQGGQVRYANAAAVCAVGYTVEELGATPAFDFVHPQDRAQTQEAIEGAGLGESVEGVELRVLTKAGDVMWVQFSATRIDFEGQPAVLVNGVDITQLKHLEQQLFQSEKLTAIGELISGITHELNNPLAAVLGYAELAQEPGVESELAGYLEKIAEQAARASGIVGNLLVFARQKEPEREAVSLNAVVSSALDLRGYELRVSNIQMLTELDESLPYVQGDFQQLVQVVLNLINNAEHAIRKHQGTGTITLRTGTFHREGMPWVRLEVLDDGPGIPEPLLTRIFDPFFSTKGPGEGTGLGLSVSYGIVSAHQGFIYAENRPEGGARLVVELPAAEAPESAPPPEPKIPSVKPARILVVEDEEAVAAMLARLLRADGHEVSVAKEGREALARVEAEHFDLVVTDFKMPGMSGLEFYRSVAETHPDLAHRIIFTTGDVLSVDTRRFLAEVGAPVLCKPYGLDQARNVIYGKLQEGGT